MRDLGQVQWIPPGPRFRGNGDGAGRARREKMQAVPGPAEACPATIQQQPDGEGLVLAHLIQVRGIAQKLSTRMPANVEVDDLVSAGVLGLLDAIDKFDPSRAIKFKTYAEIRIQGAMLDSLRGLDWAPRSLRRKSKQIHRERTELERCLGRSPTDEEICERMNMPLNEFHQLVARIPSLAVASLESLVERAEAGREGTVSIPIPEAPERGPFWLCYRSEIRHRLAAAIAKLPRRECLVVLLHYFDEMSMEELGRVLGVSIGVVSAIHSKAIGRLRISLRKLKIEQACRTE